MPPPPPPPLRLQAWASLAECMALAASGPTGQARGCEWGRVGVAVGGLQARTRFYPSRRVPFVVLVASLPASAKCSLSPPPLSCTQGQGYLQSTKRLNLVMKPIVNELRHCEGSDLSARRAALRCWCARQAAVASGALHSLRVGRGS